MNQAAVSINSEGRLQSIPRGMVQRITYGGPTEDPIAAEKRQAEETLKAQEPAAFGTVPPGAASPSGEVDAGPPGAAAGSASISYLWSAALPGAGHMVNGELGWGFAHLGAFSAAAGWAGAASSTAVERHNSYVRTSRLLFLLGLQGTVSGDSLPAIWFNRNNRIAYRDSVGRANSAVAIAGFAYLLQLGHAGLSALGQSSTLSEQTPSTPFVAFDLSHTGSRPEPRILFGEIYVF